TGRLRQNCRCRLAHAEDLHHSIASCDGGCSVWLVGRKGAVVDPAVSVAGVSKRYGNVQALAGVDLKVPQGLIFGLVGPNGAGKTTLIRSLVGALRVETGRIRVLGVDPIAQRRLIRPRIGYMPQVPVLYGDLTARENVTFFARGHLSEDLPDKVASALDFVDLNDSADRAVRTLSGGLQQRVSMAAALVHEPQVLLLDEPTAGVDPQLRHSFWQRFRRLADSGVTLLISTHQMDEVVHCDRVAVLRAGGILADARPAELFATGCATIRISDPTGTSEHHVASLPENLPSILHDRGLDPRVTRIDIAGPTLEEVILTLIEGGREEPDAS
ncbi:MAG: ABC transporter ATP-binding protein, partial [Acidimicrobiia bacterium]